MHVVKGAGQLSEIDCIEINPEVLLGQPAIRGTWIPAEMILRKLLEKVLEAEPGERYFTPPHPRGHQATLGYGADAILRETRARLMRAERRRARGRGSPPPARATDTSSLPSAWNSRSDRGRRSLGALRAKD
jgi:hypothetical protein